MDTVLLSPFKAHDESAHFANDMNLTSTLVYIMLTEVIGLLNTS